jgi:hypothetical protein
MLTDLWHHWSLLRPLLVFTLAGPLLVFAVLFRARDQPRCSEGKTHDDDAPASQSAITQGHPPQEAARQVATDPREWPTGGVASDRRAA